MALIPSELIIREDCLDSTLLVDAIVDMVGCPCAFFSVSSPFSLSALSSLSTLDKLVDFGFGFGSGCGSGCGSARSSVFFSDASSCCFFLRIIIFFFFTIIFFFVAFGFGMLSSFVVPASELEIEIDTGVDDDDDDDDSNDERAGDDTVDIDLALSTKV